MFQLNNGAFIQPLRLAPSAWTGHIPFAGWLVEAAKPSMLVELGTHHGTSYLAFCQAIAESGLAAKCFAVDTWEGDEHAGTYDDSVYTSLLEYHQEHYADFSTLMRMTFDEASAYFDDGSIDLLHIDGLHTYEAVKHDFETWLPKLSDRAIVLFHDTCVRERGFGVWKFWEDVRTRYPSYEFTHAHGLGVLAVGKRAHPLLEAPFLDASDVGATRINRLFDRLAVGISRAGLQQPSGQQDTTPINLPSSTKTDELIDKLQATVNPLQVQVDYFGQLLKKQISATLRAERQLRTEIRRLHAGLADCQQKNEEQASELSAEIEAAHLKLHDTTAKLQARNSEVMSLKPRLEEAERTIATYEVRAEHHNREHERLVREASALRAELKEKAETSLLLSFEVDRLNKDLHECEVDLKISIRHRKNFERLLADLYQKMQGLEQGRAEG